MVDALLDYGGQEVVDSFVMLLSMISSVYVDDFMRESSPFISTGLVSRNDLSECSSAGQTVFNQLGVELASMIHFFTCFTRTVVFESWIRTLTIECRSASVFGDCQC